MLLGRTRLVATPNAATCLDRTRRLRAHQTRHKHIVAAALVERLPALTPPTPPWKQQSISDQRRFAEALAKEYPQEFHEAEEGPDAKKARIRLEAIVDAESRRQGVGDDDADEASLDRRLAQRLYLLLRVDGVWRFPQLHWPPQPSAGDAPVPSMRDAILGELSASCGDEMKCHWMGNAPAAHLEGGAETTFFWKVQLLHGEPQTADGVSHAWLTKEELAERLGGGDKSAFVLEMCGPFP